MVDRSLIVMVDAIGEVVEVAREAEAAGFDGLWTTEFYDRDGFVRMAAMGMATQRLRICSGIAYAFVRNPVLTAAGAADLDDLTGGRIVLGLGTGTRRMNESWYGIPFAHPAPKMRETVQLLRALWAARKGPRFSFEGRFYRITLENYSLAQMRREALPIYVAGVNTGMIGVAGQVADGLVGHPLYSRRYLAEVVRPALAAGAMKAGRASDAPKVAGYVITAVSEDAERARQDAKHQIAFYSTVRSYDPILDRHGWERQKEEIRAAFARRDPAGMAAAVTDDMLDAIAIAGTPDECRAQFTRYEGLLDEALFYTPTFGIPRERVGENHRLILETFGQ